MNKKELLKTLLLLATYTAALAGILTLIPLASAKEPNLFGYKSICSFTPASTVICLLLANTFYSVRQKTFSA